MPTLQTVKNPHLTFDSKNSTTNSLMFTGRLTINTNGQLTHILCYILYSYNTAREDIKKTIKKIHLQYLFLKIHISGPKQFKPLLFKGQLYRADRYMLNFIIYRLSIRIKINSYTFSKKNPMQKWQ